MALFDEEMHRLDEGLKALQIEYSRYFTGALDRPPVELQSLSLLGVADVQETFHDRRTPIDEQFLEFVDHVETVLPDLFGNQLIHPHDEHVFVLRPIKNAHVASPRHGATPNPRWTKSFRFAARKSKKKMCSQSLAWFPATCWKTLRWRS